MGTGASEGTSRKGKCPKGYTGPGSQERHAGSHCLLTEKEQVGVVLRLWALKRCSVLPSLAHPMSFLFLEALGGETGNTEAQMEWWCVCVCVYVCVSCLPLLGLGDGCLPWHSSLPPGISTATSLGVLSLTQGMIPGEEAVISNAFIEGLWTLGSDQEFLERGQRVPRHAMHTWI